MAFGRGGGDEHEVIFAQRDDRHFGQDPPAFIGEVAQPMRPSLGTKPVMRYQPALALPQAIAGKTRQIEHPAGIAPASASS